MMVPAASPKNQWVALGLCVCLGFLGAHRFYVGKRGTGVLYFFTGGGFFVGWLMDVFSIATGTFKDKQKLPLKQMSPAPPPVYIQHDPVKRIAVPFLDAAEQLKRAFVPAMPQAPAPPPPSPAPETQAMKPDAGTPAGRCVQAVLDYLRQNESTPFFREKLNAIAEKLALFAKRSGIAREIIIERFGPEGLTYSKFTAPVAALEEHSVGMVNHLLSKMQLFDEEDCKRRIQELIRADRYAEMREYMALEANYKDFAEKALSALEDALLRLDKLIYEMTKLDEAGMDQATSVLDGIDELIRDTPRYS